MGKVQTTLLVSLLAFIVLFFNVPETIKYVAAGVIVLCFLYLTKILIWKK